MKKLTRHPLSAIWPDQAETEFEALCRDIEKNGVRSEITIYEGQVLDGWHRCLAAFKVGCTNIPIRKLKEDVDPARFVCSMNAHRRHLTKTQLVASIYRSIGRHKRPTGREIAEMAQCSVNYVAQIRRYVDEGRGDELIEGSITLGNLNEAAARAAGRPATRREQSKRASRKKDRRIVADYSSQILLMRKALLQCSCPCNKYIRTRLEEHTL